MPTARENLIAAKALIDTPEKWGKNFYYERDGCLCVVGAVGKASGLSAAGGQWCYSVIDALCSVLPDTAPIRNHLPAYNDHPDTTHADIMALFVRGGRPTPSGRRTLRLYVSIPTGAVRPTSRLVP